MGHYTSKPMRKTNGCPIARSIYQAIQTSNGPTAEWSSVWKNKRVGERPRAQMNERPIDWLSARTNFRPNERTVKSNHRTIELKPTYDRIALESMERRIEWSCGRAVRRRSGRTMKSAHENQQFSDATIEHSNYDKGSRERMIERLILNGRTFQRFAMLLGSISCCSLAGFHGAGHVEVNSMYGRAPHFHIAGVNDIGKQKPSWNPDLLNH